MIYKGKEELELATLKVRYTDNGEEFERYVGEEGQEWWIDFDDKWDHLKIIEFIEVEPTDEQLRRFEEVKDIDANLFTLNDYIENGVLGEGLELLRMRKENKELQQLLADLTEIVLMGGI